jgi:hypothetical protein
MTQIICVQCVLCYSDLNYDVRTATQWRFDNLYCVYLIEKLKENIEKLYVQLVPNLPSTIFRICQNKYIYFNPSRVLLWNPI